MGVGRCVGLCLSLSGSGAEINHPSISRFAKGLVAAPIRANHVRVWPAIWVAATGEEVICRCAINYEAVFTVFLLVLVLCSTANGLNALKCDVPVLFQSA